MRLIPLRFAGLLFLLFLCFCTSPERKASERKSARAIKKDTIENNVIFLVDDPLMVEGELQPVRAYTLDSLGWGKGFDIVPRFTNVSSTHLEIKTYKSLKIKRLPAFCFLQHPDSFNYSHKNSE